MKDDIALKLINRANKLKSERMNYENVYRDIDKYVLNSPTGFNVRLEHGAANDTDIYDTTAVTANRMLSASIHSGLTSTAKKWFDLAPVDTRLRDKDSVRRWVDSVVRVMLNVFNSTESNFAQQNHECLMSMCSYGTACMYVDSLPNGQIRFNARHLNEIYIMENSTGTIDTVFRKFKYTARQAYQEFGEDNLGTKVLESLKSDPDKEYCFIHICMPINDAKVIYEDEQPLASDFTFVSYVVCEEDKKLVQRKGYYDLPYIVGRFDKRSGEVYGISPAWAAMADIKMVNKMSETVIRAAEKSVDPPMLMADDGVLIQLETLPGGVNVGGLSDDGRPLVAPLVTGANVGIGLEMIEQRREAIRRAYFVNQFFQKSGTPLSATEFAKRADDELSLGAPNLFRIRAEFLSKIVNRVFNILLRQTLELPEGLKPFPMPPRELANADLSVEYVNPLIRQQRFDELEAVNRAVNSVLPLIQTDPTLLDNFIGDKLIRDAAEISGIPVSSLRPTDSLQDVQTLEELRQQRAEQQQQQQLLALQQQQVQTQ